MLKMKKIYVWVKGICDEPNWSNNIISLLFITKDMIDAKFSLKEGHMK